MSDPFVAEIRMVGFNFAPTGWAFCDGQLLPISQNTALFSLVGTMYGGNGKSNFALPNFQGRVPVMFGQGPGLSLRDQGEMSGSESVTLLQSEIPTHSHTISASNTSNTPNPSGAAWGTLSGRTPPPRYSSGAANTTLSPQALAPVGGNMPHNNLMPYLTVNFIIALFGVYPPRG